ncbi:hypothetical protein D3C71_1857300 [compost metagenome]
MLLIENFLRLKRFSNSALRKLFVFFAISESIGRNANKVRVVEIGSGMIYSL